MAWRDQQVGQVIALGAQALELWESQPESYPFHCLALCRSPAPTSTPGRSKRRSAWPVGLLEPSQARLPDELEAAVIAACEAWDRAETREGGPVLGGAVTASSRTPGYA